MQSLFRSIPTLFDKSFHIKNFLQSHQIYLNSVFLLMVFVKDGPDIGEVTLRICAPFTT
jgi:hypothetical protein